MVIVMVSVIVHRLDHGENTQLVCVCVYVWLVGWLIDEWTDAAGAVFMPVPPPPLLRIVVCCMGCVPLPAG